jgi:hypothetical protein
MGSVSSRRVLVSLSGGVLALVLAFAPGCGKGAGDGSPTLVTIGSRKVSLADFEAYARDPQIVQPYLSLPDSVAKKTLLDDLLSYELFAEAATRQGLDKDSAYLAIEDQVLPRLLPDALYEAKIGKQIKVSEEEAKLFDAQQTHEYQLGVLMTTEPAPMNALLARLDKGEDFAEVARTGSQDPGSAQSGGRLPGWILLGQLPPDVEPQVKKLAKGQRTGVIPQRTGSYVFQVFDMRPRENVTPFEERKAEVMQSLEARKRGAMVDEYLMGLRKSYQLSIDGPGWTVIGEKFIAYSDSMAGMAIMNPSASGLTEAELASNVATWRDRKYTVRDMLTDLGKTERMERPPLSRSDMVRMYVEGHAMNEILVAEAKAQGLADSPEVRRQVSRARTAYLVNRYLERNMSASSLGSPSEAELDSTTAALVRGMGGPAGGPVPTFSQLPPQIQQQIVADWQQRKRQALLKTEVERLKAEIKPVVNEKAFAPIPWPVPAADA